DSRPWAHRRAGTVNKHGPVADLVRAVHLEEDRVDPGLRQVIIEPAVDQLDERCLDLGPAVSIDNVLAGRIGRQAVTGLKYAFVIEVDPRRRSFLYHGPLGLFESGAGAHGQLAESRAVVIESVQQTTGNVGSRV